MTMQSSLANIETMLAKLVGGAVTKRMGPTEFVRYAHAEVAKAMGEPPEASTQRLKALHRAVTVFKDNFSSDEDVNVPIYVNDVTAMDDKSSTMTTPAAAAKLNPDGETAFEQGFVVKVESLRAQIKDLMKEFPPPKDDEEEEKKAAASDDDDEPPESEDEEKKKAAGKPPFPPTPPTPPTPKKPTPPDADGEKAKTKKVAKGDDVSSDGTPWPADLNDPSFVKDGKIEKNADWGQDPV